MRAFDVLAGLLGAVCNPVGDWAIDRWGIRWAFRAACAAFLAACVGPFLVHVDPWLILPRLLFCMYVGGVFGYVLFRYVVWQRERRDISEYIESRRRG